MSLSSRVFDKLIHVNAVFFKFQNYAKSNIVLFMWYRHGDIIFRPEISSTKYKKYRWRRTKSSDKQNAENEHKKMFHCLIDVASFFLFFVKHFSYVPLSHLNT